MDVGVDEHGFSRVAFAGRFAGFKSGQRTGPVAFVDESEDWADNLALSRPAPVFQLDFEMSRCPIPSKSCDSLRRTRKSGPVTLVEESEERANELGLSRVGSATKP